MSIYFGAHTSALSHMYRKITKHSTISRTIPNIALTHHPNQPASSLPKKHPNLPSTSVQDNKSCNRHTNSSSHIDKEELLGKLRQGWRLESQQVKQALLWITKRLEQHEIIAERRSPPRTVKQLNIQKWRRIDGYGAG